MLKAVVDTNVLVSGTILSRGHPFEILEAWRGGEFILMISPDILAEIEVVLGRPKIFLKYRLTEGQISGVMSALEHEATIVAPTAIDPPPRLEQADLKFLACARAGGADYFVTGDRALVTLQVFQGTYIVEPRAFTAILRAARR